MCCIVLLINEMVPTIYHRKLPQKYHRKPTGQEKYDFDHSKTFFNI